MVRADALLTQRHKREFLENYLESRYICAAAKKTGVAASTVWRWWQADPEFQKVFEETRAQVEKQLVAKLEAEADRRAATGTLKPVYQGGKKVGEVREFSDTLLIFRLKGLAPDKYRERIEQEHKGTINVAIKEVEVIKDYGGSNSH